MKKDYKVIGFDADDTMWVNEPYYRETKDVFYGLLSDYIEGHAIHVPFHTTLVHEEVTMDQKPKNTMK